MSDQEQEKERTIYGGNYGDLMAIQIIVEYGGKYCGDFWRPTVHIQIQNPKINAQSTKDMTRAHVVIVMKLP